MSNKQQTAVEWVVEQLLKKSDIQHINGFDYLIEQAKAMEKEQIINCCIETTQSCYIAVMVYLNEPLKFTDEDLNNQKLEAEQYYNETYGE